MTDLPYNCSSILHAYLHLQRIILKIFLLSLAFMTILPGQASDVLTIDPMKRLEATICVDSMNRIAVANDRITQIFGDEGTFESQNDENTGQVFLKPTAENGSKNVSITLITEQGITQDLTLKPTAKSARTLILKNESGRTAKNASLPNQNNHGAGVSRSEANPYALQPFPSQFQERNCCPQDQLLVLIKQAVMQQLPAQEGGSFFGGSDVSRMNSEGLRVSHQQLYIDSPYGVHVFEVENTSQTSREIEEKSFYQTGDLAISLEKRTLAPNSVTSLYVITLEGQHHD